MSEYGNRNGVECGHCGATLKANEKYCRYCGTKKGEGSYTPAYDMMLPVYGPGPEEAVVTCTKCGKKWETYYFFFGGGSNEDFCPECGGPTEVTRGRLEWDLEGEIHGGGFDSAAVSLPRLNLFYMLDISGSMYGDKIQQLNCAMEQAVKVAEKAAKSLEAELAMRFVTISSVPQYILGTSKEVGISDVVWTPLQAGGSTDTAGAIRLVREAMHTKYMCDYAVKPVVIWISDGVSNNRTETKKAMDELRTSLTGRTDRTKDKIIRIALGVKGYDSDELEYFVSTGTIQYGNGSKDENVKFVFDVNDLSRLEGLLKSITKSSLVSAVSSCSELPVVEVEWDD